MVIELRGARIARLIWNYEDFYAQIVRRKVWLPIHWAINKIQETQL